MAQTLNRDGEGPALGANAADALKMLGQQGRVVEIPERGRLVQGAVDCYLEESARTSPKGKPQRVLIFTPLNGDRRELNEMIRQAGEQRGELDQGVKVPVLAQTGQGGTTEAYRRAWWSP